MSKKDIVTGIGRSKVWGYVAMAAGILGVFGVAILVKEELDARKASENLKIAESDLKSVKEEVIKEEVLNELDTVVTEASGTAAPEKFEEASQCCGGQS